MYCSNYYYDYREEAMNEVYDAYDSVYGVVIRTGWMGSTLVLENGQEAFSSGFSAPVGTEVLCSVGFPASAGNVLQVRIDSCFHEDRYAAAAAV